MNIATQTCLNILVAEDNAGDARLVDELLKESDLGAYDVTYISDWAEAADFDTTQFNIILLDLHLSDMSPLETFKHANETFPHTPIVILTGLQDDELAANIVRMGAQDYLVKGTFDAGTLKRSITYSIERKKSALLLARSLSKSRYLKAKTAVLQDETKRLEALNAAKDTFMSIASHQLRTPATSVKQYLGMVLEGYGGEVPDGLRNFIETAFRSNERQLKIINELLEVARLEAGKVVLHKSAVDVIELMQNILFDLAPTFAARNHSVHFTPLEKSLQVDIDENKMRMVFENILDNACKYSPDHTDIDIRIAHQEDMLSVEFKDRGMGISETDIGKLFQKFSRVGESFTKSPDGSGLGLYWAREIVKLHGGAIQLKSKLGKGSVFTICIPYTAGAES